MLWKDSAYHCTYVQGLPALLLLCDKLQNLVYWLVPQNILTLTLDAKREGHIGVSIKIVFAHPCKEKLNN